MNDRPGEAYYSSLEELADGGAISNASSIL